MREQRSQDLLIAILIGVAAIVVAAGWLGAWTPTKLSGRRFDGELTDGLRAVISYLTDPGRPPAEVWGDPDVPGPWLVYPATLAWAAVLGTAAGGAVRVIGGPAGGFTYRRRLGVDPKSRFARRRELATLWIRRPVPGRFILGRVGHRTLASTNPRHLTDGLSHPDRIRRRLSRRGQAEAFGGVMLIGLSQTGKSQHALTALRALSAAGCPMICSSVKGDIIEHLLAQRRRVGQVGIFDPTGTLAATYQARRATGRAVPQGWDPRLCVGWSPLDGVATFDQAVAAAHRLAEAGPGMDQVTGGDFWREQAEMLIAPLLWIAAHNRLDMGDVTLWVLAEDRPDADQGADPPDGYTPEPVRFLEPLRDDPDPAVQRDARKAEQVLHGLWNKADTTVGSVYATANTILRPWATEHGRHSSTGQLVNLDWLLAGPGHNTLAISAPPQEQRQLRPVLTGAVSSILDAVYRHVELHGPLDPPLVVFLDEIGNAPLARLPEYLSTLASAGVLLITVWQDVSQIRKAYSDHAGSILSNSRHVLIFGGSKDTATLDWVRQILGDEAADTTSVTSNVGDLLGGSVSASQQLVPLTPGNVLRQMPRHRALLISANNPPAAVRHLPDHSIKAFAPLRRWPHPDHSPLGIPVPVVPSGRAAATDGDGLGAIYRAEQRYAADRLAGVFDSVTVRAVARLADLVGLRPSPPTGDDAAATGDEETDGPGGTVRPAPLPTPTGQPMPLECAGGPNRARRQAPRSTSGGGRGMPATPRTIGAGRALRSRWAGAAPDPPTPTVPARRRAEGSTALPRSTRPASRTSSDSDKGTNPMEPDNTKPTDIGTNPDTDPTYDGRPTPIDGVLDTSATITGTRVEWGDSVDLPVGDGVAGLVLFHVPRYLDPGRHHQQSPADYLAWLVEVVDEAERVLELGGRLVLIARPHESTRPHIDVPTQLLRPLESAGFTTPSVHTWIPDPAGGPGGSDRSEVLERSARSWWRVLIAGKGLDHRTGTTRQRRKAGLPHTAGAVPDHLLRLAARAHWPITTTPQGAQGDLPAELVTLIVSTFTYLDDVIINPLTGPSSVVADIARQLRRRALCFEPDRVVLTRHHDTPGDPTDPEDER